MQSSQQIIGVNNRLGNPAVASMQGTTRAIYDVAPSGINQTFFSNVQTRPYPLSNISQNRFEVGESLAIESIALVLFDQDTAFPQPGPITNYLGSGSQTNPILNLYIGNQRVIKDLDLSYCLTPLGNTNVINAGSNFLNANAVFRLETPIVIPPQIEFYATVQYSSSSLQAALILQGTGTLLNPKSNF
jgi:hypothetical protein